MKFCHLECAIVYRWAGSWVSLYFILLFIIIFYVQKCDLVNLTEHITRITTPHTMVSGYNGENESKIVRWLQYIGWILLNCLMVIWQVICVWIFIYYFVWMWGGVKCTEINVCLKMDWLYMCSWFAWRVMVSRLVMLAISFIINKLKNKAEENNGS